MRLPVAACVLALLLPPVAAHAGERVEGFEGFLAGATITNQVSGASFPESPQVFDPIHTTAFSEPHALRKAAPCNDYQCDNGAYRMTINFTEPASQVQVRVGNDEGGCFEFCPLARMVAYSGENATGSIVADSLAYGSRPLVQEPNQYGPITVQLTATASGYEIRSVRVFTGREEGVPGEVFSGPVRVQLDDLRFIVQDPGDPPPPPPPPTPSPPWVTISEPRPGTVTDETDLFVRGSVYAQGGLVARCVSVDAPDTLPADCPGTDQQGRYAEFVRGLSVGTHTLTVWALDGHGQTGNASTTIEVARNLGADIAVELMEPIQVVQRYDLPELQPELRRTPAISYAHRQADYTGVPLARHKRTIVRLHATREAAGAARDFMPLAFLYGYRVGGGGDLSPLAGNPLRPIASPSSLPGGPDSDSAEAIGVRRAQDGDPYLFELPYSWTSGRVLLVGEVNRPGLPQSRSECDGCLEDNAYALDVRFADGGNTHVYPLWLNYPGVELPGTLAPFYRPPFAAFYRTYQISPFTINVHPYAALIDVSDLAARTNPRNNATRSDVVERVQETKDTMGLPDHTIGLQDGVFGSVARTVDNAGFLDIYEENAAEVDVTRPLQAVGHELVHLMGAPVHAGTRCPSDADPGDWPPDQMGLIQGWGIDVTGVRGRLKVFGQASPGLFDPGPATTDFDLMSYCVTDRDENESDTWMSVRRWTNRFIHVGGGGGFRTSRSTGTSAVAPGPLTDVIRVVMQLASDGSLQIVDTTRGLGRAVGTGGSLTVNLLNGAGDVIRSGGVVRFADHIHEPDGPIPDTFVATLPVGRQPPASVEVEDGAGTVYAQRAASQRPPSVKLRSPGPGDRQRVRGALKMRWSASDPDGDLLTTRIDLSTNDGRTWTPVALDVSGERFRVPAPLLQRTRRGRVRVVVEDGFHQSRAVSGRLRIDGIRPQVVILNPVRGQRLAADARLNLVGQAFNDAGRELRGRALRWTSRGRRLGRGSALSVLAAEVGRRVTLVARDRFGRVGRATVRVRVVPVRPVFTRFDAPKSLRRGARKLRITVASSLPGKLKVKGRGVRRTRAAVGPNARRVVVPVRSRRPLRLRVAVRALGRTTKTRLRIPRR